MALVLKNNIPARNALNQLDKNDKQLTKDLKKVASGMKITSAQDDASGYAISEKMRVQINGYDQDIDNTQTGASMLKVAEGGLQSTVDVLRTLKEKAINAANDTNTDLDRNTIQKEFNEAVDQLDENANVQYNGKTMLDGSKNNAVNAPGTRSVYSIDNLSPSTTLNTALTALTDVAGRSLGIQPNDRIEISYVQNGEQQGPLVLSPARDYNISTLFGRGVNLPLSTQAGTQTQNPLLDRTGAPVATVDGKSHIFIGSNSAGLSGQISGITFNVTNAGGVPNQQANSILNDMTEIIPAENPSEDNALVFQVGIKANQSVKIGFSDMRAYALGLRDSQGNSINIATQKHANTAIAVLENALQKALNQQTTIGSVESRMNLTENDLTTQDEYTQASESVIRDADMAKEITHYTKSNVLAQAAQAMLAQANSNSSSVLSLLSGGQAGR